MTWENDSESNGQRRFEEIVSHGKSYLLWKGICWCLRSVWLWLNIKVSLSDTVKVWTVTFSVVDDERHESKHPDSDSGSARADQAPPWSADTTGIQGYWLQTVAISASPGLVSLERMTLVGHLGWIACLNYVYYVERSAELFRYARPRSDRISNVYHRFGRKLNLIFT